ncbi:hypothetical protein [Pseudomonas lactis]|uniref:hypothetical protein n=1 Tax=Pseudomonas lactis TaxID=1615674 RepID=UPI002490D592|nr:hypothetical protein [Pseudomonas lactis]
MTNETEFASRPACIIDWPRQFECGPSDEHLHAIGQFMVAYSLVEWDISSLFTYFSGLSADRARRLIVETNMPTAGMIKFVTESLRAPDQAHPEAAQDLLSVFQTFEALTKERHRIVHWQWAMSGNQDASLSNLIKPKKTPNADHSLSLETLRNFSLMLIKIGRAFSFNMLIIREQNTREQILSVIGGTSPGTPFRV